MGIAGLEMTPEPARLPSNGLLMDDVETDPSGDGDIVLPQEPPALVVADAKASAAAAAGAQSRLKAQEAGALSTNVAEILRPTGVAQSWCQRAYCSATAFREGPLKDLSVTIH
eukprot:s9122_g1.t1